MDKLEYIKSRVEQETGYELSGRSRKRELVAARCIYAGLAYKHTFDTLDNIGRPIGREHDMIIHYKKTLPVHLKYEKPLEKLYYKLDKEFRRKFCEDQEKLAIYKLIESLPKRKYKKALQKLEILNQ